MSHVLARRPMSNPWPELAEAAGRTAAAVLTTAGFAGWLLVILAMPGLLGW